MPVKKVQVEKSNRLYLLPPTIESTLPQESRQSLLRKTATIDLATFRWPVAVELDETDSRDALVPANSRSLGELREELAGWFHSYHGVRLDPDREILIGGGISNLLLNTAMAFVDHGSLTFVPELAIPQYRRVTIACGGEAVSYGISGRNGWQPDFERVNTRLGRVAVLLFLNSPHNPTGAELAQKEMVDLVWRAGRENIMIVNDAAYATISGRRYTSLLSVTGGKRVGVEVYSLPYAFGLPAMRFGFMAGNREIIQGVRQAARLTPHLVSAQAVAMATRSVRQFPAEPLKTARSLIDENAAEITRILSHLKLTKSSADTIPFCWARLERRSQAVTAATTLYRRGHILVTPGTAFGDSGEGYLRFSLTAPPGCYQDAAQRVRRKYRRAKLSNDT